MAEQISYSQVIEFFWFFFTLLLFIFSALMKFYLKIEIHQDQNNIRAKAYSLQNLKQQNQNDNIEISGPEIQVVETNVNNQAAQTQFQINNLNQKESKQIQLSQDNNLQPQLSTISPNLQENTKTAKFFNAINEMVSTYLPLLSIVILCINNFAVWGWALSCVIIYLVFVILFNILQIQKNYSENIRQFLYVSHHIWICGIFIAYLACQLKLDV